MNFQKEENRIFLTNEQGKLVAEIVFEKIEDHTYNISHTFVDESLRGQGIASKLVEEAVKEVKSKNANVVATCSYAKAWLERNNEQKDKR